MKRRIKIAIVMAYRALRGRTIDIDTANVDGEYHFIAIEKGTL